MHPRTRLVYFYFLRVNFLVKTSTSGRRNQVRLPWQRYTCQSKYGCFCSSPQVTYLHTKNEGGYNFLFPTLLHFLGELLLKPRFLHWHPRCTCSYRNNLQSLHTSMPCVFFHTKIPLRRNLSRLSGSKSGCTFLHRRCS